MHVCVRACVRACVYRCGCEYECMRAVRTCMFVRACMSRPENNGTISIMFEDYSASLLYICAKK